MHAHSRPSRPANFDLLQNPFVVLGITPATSNEGVLEAFEDALADGIYSENELNDAKQLLLNPRLRLNAELSFLLDTPIETARGIYDRLRQGARRSELRTIIDRLAPLSRINLISHLANTEPCSSEHVVSYIAARHALSAEAIHSTITRLRKHAGIVSIELSNVSDALHGLDDLHTKCLLHGFHSARDAADAMRRCSEQIVLSATPEQVDILESVLRAYSSLVNSELSELNEHITHNLIEIEAAERSVQEFNDLSNNLLSWNTIDEPLQILAHFKGRDEPNARALFDNIRSLAIRLANERGLTCH